VAGAEVVVAGVAAALAEAAVVSVASAVAAVAAAVPVADGKLFKKFYPGSIETVRIKASKILIGF